MFNFTPTDSEQANKVPFLEDATADFAPYYRSRKTLKGAQNEVAAELIKLDAIVIAFQAGYFGNNPRRYGYQVRFAYMGAPGVIRVAGLPIRGNATGNKLEQVRVQALLNVRDWLKASVTQAVFSPGSHPLMMNLLVDDRRTVAEAMLESGRLALPGPADGSVVDGDFVEY